MRLPTAKKTLRKSMNQLCSVGRGECMPSDELSLLDAMNPQGKHADRQSSMKISICTCNKQDTRMPSPVSDSSVIVRDDLSPMSAYKEQAQEYIALVYWKRKLFEKYFTIWKCNYQDSVRQLQKARNLYKEKSNRKQREISMNKLLQSRDALGPRAPEQKAKSSEVLSSSSLEKVAGPFYDTYPALVLKSQVKSQESQTGEFGNEEQYVIRNNAKKTEEKPALISVPFEKDDSKCQKRYSYSLRTLYMVFKEWTIWAKQHKLRMKNLDLLASRLSSATLQRHAYFEWKESSRRSRRLRSILYHQHFLRRMNSQRWVFAQLRTYVKLKQRFSFVQYLHCTRLIKKTMHTWWSYTTLTKQNKATRAIADRYVLKKLAAPAIRNWIYFSRDKKCYRMRNNTAIAIHNRRLLRKYFEEWCAYAIMIAFNAARSFQSCTNRSYVDLQYTAKKYIRLVISVHQWKQKSSDHKQAKLRQEQALKFATFSILRRYFSHKWASYVQKRKRTLQAATTEVQALHRIASQRLGISVLRRYANMLQRFSHLVCRVERRQSFEILAETFGSWKRMSYQTLISSVIYTAQNRRNLKRTIMEWKEYNTNLLSFRAKKLRVIHTHAKHEKVLLWARWKCVFALRKKLFLVASKQNQTLEIHVWRKWREYAHSNAVSRRKIEVFKCKEITRFSERIVLNNWYFYISRKRCERQMIYLHKKKAFRGRIRKALIRWSTQAAAIRLKRRSVRAMIRNMMQQWQAISRNRRRVHDAQCIADEFYSACRLGTAIARWAAYLTGASKYSTNMLAADRFFRLSSSRKILYYWLYQVARCKSIRQLIYERNRGRRRVTISRRWIFWTTYAMKRRNKKQYRRLICNKLKEINCRKSLVVWVTFALKQKDLKTAHAAIVQERSNAMCSKIYRSWCDFVDQRRQLVRHQSIAARDLERMETQRTIDVWHAYASARRQNRYQVQEANIFHEQYIKCLTYARWRQYYYSCCLLHLCKNQILARRYSAALEIWLNCKADKQRQRSRQALVMHTMCQLKLTTHIQKWHNHTIQTKKLSSLCCRAKMRQQRMLLKVAWSYWDAFLERMKSIRRKLLIAFEEATSTKVHEKFFWWAKFTRLKHKCRTLTKELCLRRVRYGCLRWKSVTITKRMLLEELLSADRHWRMRRLKKTMHALNHRLATILGQKKARDFCKAKRLQLFVIWKSNSRLHLKKRSVSKQVVINQSRAEMANCFTKWRNLYVKYRFDDAIKADAICRRAQYLRFLRRLKQFHAWKQKALTIITLPKRLALQKVFGQWLEEHQRLKSLTERTEMAMAAIVKKQLQFACNGWHKWTVKRLIFNEKKKHARIMYHWCLVLHSWNAWKLYHDGCHNERRMISKVQNLDRMRFFKEWHMFTVRNIEIAQIFEAICSKRLLHYAIVRWLHFRRQRVILQEKLFFAGYCDRLRQLCIGLTGLTNFQQQRMKLRSFCKTAQYYCYRKLKRHGFRAWRQSIHLQQEYCKKCTSLTMYKIQRKLHEWNHYKDIASHYRNCRSNLQSTLCRRSVRVWNEFVKTQRTRKHLHQIYCRQLCTTSWNIWNRYIRLNRISFVLRRYYELRNVVHAFALWTDIFHKQRRADTFYRYRLLIICFHTLRNRHRSTQAKMLSWEKAIQFHVRNCSRHTLGIWIHHARQRILHTQRSIKANDALLRFTLRQKLHTWRHYTTSTLRCQSHIQKILCRCSEQMIQQIIRRSWQQWTIQMRSFQVIKAAFLQWEAVTCKSWIHHKYTNYFLATKRLRICKQVMNQWKYRAMHSNIPK